MREICCDIYENVIEADLTDNVVLGKSADALLDHLNLSKKTSYDDMLKLLVEKVIHHKFATQFYDSLRTETLLKKFANGEYSGELLFMDNTYSENYLWKSAKITLYYFESTKTVRAIIFVRNIDEEKRKEVEQAAYTTAVQAFWDKADAWKDELDELYDSSDVENSNVMIMY